MQLLPRRQPRRPGAPGGSRTAICCALGPSEPNGSALGADKPLHGRTYGQLSPGVQPYRSDRERGDPGSCESRTYGEMIERLLIMGATGDLTARYLLPALASLRGAGRIG